jgi:hypothetical protein
MGPKQSILEIEGCIHHAQNERLLRAQKAAANPPIGLRMLEQEEEVEMMSTEIGAARWRRARAAWRRLGKAEQGCLEETPCRGPR